MVVIHPDYGVVVGKETEFRNAVILDLNLHSPYEHNSLKVHSVVL